QRAWPVAAAGALAAFELIHSLDYGLIVLAGGGTGLALASLLDSGGARSRLRGAARTVGLFAGGALVGALPFVLLLARRGALSSFLRASFVDAPRWVDAAWGLPAGRTWDSLVWSRSVNAAVKILAGDAGMHALFFLLLLAAAAAALVLVRLHPARALDAQLSSAGGAARRDRETRGAAIPRSGGALLSEVDAARFATLADELNRRLRPEETFFDFDNQPGLYFV